MMRDYRVAYLVSHPIQYQAPMLRYLAAKPEIDLTVFFLSDHSVREHYDGGFGVRLQWDVKLLEGYRHLFVPVSGKRHALKFWKPFVYGLKRHLSEGRFDMLWLHGYAHPLNLAAIVIAKQLGMKVMVRGESHLRMKNSPAGRILFKSLALPRLFELIDGFLAIGSWNRDYYLHYGAPQRKIFTMPYAVDNDFFRARVVEARASRTRLKATLGLQSERPVILYASKFQQRKRARDLLEAYARLSPDGSREPYPYLLFVGDGETRRSLEAEVRRLGWSSVKFLGFVNQTELPGFYDLCDVFVLPSEAEPWGLVVNEVMNAGKPLIVSDQAGAGPDLVKEGKNGFVVPVGDVAALADRLRALTSDLVRCRKMGRESLTLVSQWDFEADYRGLLQALETIVATRN